MSITVNVPDRTIDPIDEPSKKRMERFKKLGVRPMKEMSVAEYDAIFKRWSFVHEVAMEQCEQVWRLMMCHACRVIDQQTNRIMASPFFVQIEKDELGVFPALAHLTCHNCGFEEYYPNTLPPEWNYAGQELKPTSAAEIMQRYHDAQNRLGNMAAGMGGMQNHLLDAINIANQQNIAGNQLNAMRAEYMKLVEREKMAKMAPPPIYGMDIGELPPGVSVKNLSMVQKLRKKMQL